jgi:hypothetical protein
MAVAVVLVRQTVPGSIIGAILSVMLTAKDTFLPGCGSLKKAESPGCQFPVKNKLHSAQVSTDKI